MTEFKQHIHFSNDFEAAVLGACLLEKTAFGRTYGIINEETFYSESNHIVYRAIEQTYTSGIPVDLLTINDCLQVKMSIPMLGGHNSAYYIVRLTNDVVSSANMEYHCYILKRMWMEREVIKLTSGGLKLEGDITNQIIQLQTAIRDIKQGDFVKEWYDAAELMVELTKHQDRIASNPEEVIKTGIQELDNKNGGFFPGNLIVIGARPGAGKSAFMGQMAINMAKEKRKVGIISLEMSNKEIAGRIASIDTDIAFAKIFRNLFDDENQKQRYHDRLAKVTGEYTISVSDKTRVTAVDIRAKADKLKATKGLDFLFIDYLQLISADQGKNKTRENIISEISRACKIMAKELNIPVCILCQLNRESTKRTGESRYPQLSDLRESGAIEQDADIVMFIHRDWVVGITQDENGNSTENKADLIVRKWRNAEPNLHLPLEFDGPKMSFKFSKSNQFKAIQPEVDYQNDNPF